MNTKIRKLIECVGEYSDHRLMIEVHGPTMTNKERKQSREEMFVLYRSMASALSDVKEDDGDRSGTSRSFTDLERMWWVQTNGATISKGVGDFWYCERKDGCTHQGPSIQHAVDAAMKDRGWL